MSNTRHMLSAVALSLSMALSVLPAQAALPLSINGQEMPSLAPVVEQVQGSRPASVPGVAESNISPPRVDALSGEARTRESTRSRERGER